MQRHITSNVCVPDRGVGSERIDAIWNGARRRLPPSLGSASALRTIVADVTGLTPKQIAVLRAQLKAANQRLLAIERQREQMQTYISTLADQLKRAESEDRSKEC